MRAPEHKNKLHKSIRQRKCVDCKKTKIFNPNVKKVNKKKKKCSCNVKTFLRLFEQFRKRFFLYVRTTPADGLLNTHTHLYVDIIPHRKIKRVY